MKIWTATLFVLALSMPCAAATAQEPEEPDGGPVDAGSPDVYPAEEDIDESAQPAPPERTREEIPAEEPAGVPEASPPPAKERPAEKRPKRTLAEMVELGARFHTGWDLTHLKTQTTELDSSGAERTVITESFDNEFYVKRARIKLEIEPTGWLLGVVQVEATGVLDGTFLRDAYVHVAPARQLGIQIGQFKKPFSALNLRSPSKRRLVNRGPGNDLIIEDLMFGDRDLGLQLSGRLVKSVKLDYAIGVFNGSGPNIGDPGKSKDAVARVQVRPHKRFEIGANGSFKFFDGAELQEGKPEWAWAAGIDVRLKVKGLRFYAEGLVGQNHIAFLEASDDSSISSADPPEFFGVTGIISYKHDFEVSWGFAIEPAFKGEFLEPTTVFVDDEVMAFTPGLNTYFGKYFRLMINGEFIRSGRNSRDDFPDQEVLMVLACLDL